ncbi:nucleotide exchange factor GrpE [Enterocloster clostridioformis]|uniref:nucleotide exchange factor GrpE n=1 Tax=Enterocloster clostridioformis TaxID=1531 RepID=UPI002674E84B|nr:nucleotide exchange factor GrpE [Enterocloster clostridioformis]
MKDEELKKEDEALKAEQAGGKDQASGTGEAKETEASNDIPETQENTPEETEETEESTEQAPAGEKEEKKGFFKKKDPRDEKIEELTDRVKRQMAEFENFRKRTDKEKSAMYEMGAKDIIERILPVIDNFERGLAIVPEDAKETPLAEGMEKIYKQFRKTLEEAGVKAIEAVGREFDPNYHNAVMHVDDDSLGENIVAEELQKGYMYRDSVVRHSMVKVAN